VPLGLNVSKVFPPGSRQLVDPRAATTAIDPGGAQPASLFHPAECRVKRPFFDAQVGAANLLDGRHDAVTMQEARDMAGLELHEHVDVTVGAEIVPEDGAKQRQPRV
jgi:hypothetical protein